MQTPITSPIPIIMDVEKGSSEGFKDWSTQKITPKSKNNNSIILVNSGDLMKKKTNTGSNQKEKERPIFYRSELRPSNYTFNKEERRKQIIFFEEKYGGWANITTTNGNKSKSYRQR